MLETIVNIIGAAMLWEKFMLPTAKIMFPVFRKLKKPLTCAPCLSFWITIILTLNPFIAFSTYICVVIISKHYDRSKL